jgi:hypothetical protein
MSSEKNAPLNSSALARLLRRPGGSETGSTMLRYRRGAIALAVVWFLGCLLWGAPAGLMALLLKPLAPQLELQTLEGSFWHGRAGAAFWQQDAQRYALGTVDWRLSPWSLLWLHPSARISTAYGDQVIDTRVRVSPLGTVQLRDLRAALPVAALTQQLPVRTDGLVGLRLERAEIARREPQLRELQGEVEWLRAAWQWNSNWVALGDYTGRITTQDKSQLRIQLEGRGALAASGEATVKLADRSYALQVLLTPAPSLPEELRDGAGAMLGGQRDTQGRWQIRRDGKW